MDLDKTFRKYYMYLPEGGINADILIDEKNEAFELFKELYDTHYGSIYEDENLISIHTGGWSENEALIEHFRYTFWWTSNLKIEAKGGHYYFNTDFHGKKEWIINKQ